MCSIFSTFQLGKLNSHMILLSGYPVYTWTIKEMSYKRGEWFVEKNQKEGLFSWDGYQPMDLLGNLDDQEIFPVRFRISDFKRGWYHSSWYKKSYQIFSIKKFQGESTICTGRSSGKVLWYRQGGAHLALARGSKSALGRQVEGTEKHYMGIEKRK